VLLQASEWDRDPAELRRRAGEFLGKLINKTSSDALLLAELHLLGNQYAAAVAELRIVANSLPSDGDRLLSFLSRLDTRLYADTRTQLLAERIYDQLEDLPAYSLKALDVRLETSLGRSSAASDQGRSLARSLVDRYIRRSIDRAAWADEPFQDLVRLMQHLISTGRAELAGELARLNLESLPSPRPAAALAASLAMSDPAADEVQRLAKALDQWLVDYPADAELLFAVANLRFACGEIPRAIQLYRSSLAQQPDRCTSMNNLALALASQQPASLDESFQLVRRAIEIDGRKSQWLDTLAVLHLMQGQYDMAAALLLDALPDAPGDESIFLHLAKAWLEQGNDALANFALNMAESRTTNHYMRLPLDRQMYQQVVEHLRTNGT
jgi:Flp pilus assembly protein TadD